jgi:hypothetical protein
MTTAEYTFLGTLTSRELFDSVTGGRSPNLQARSVSAQKSTREAKVIKALTAVVKGPYRQQFTPERLADALAMCDRRWEHFQSPGNLQPADRMLPRELAELMRADRTEQSEPSQLPREVEQSAASKLLDDVVEHVPTARQKAHTGRKVFKLGAGVPVVKSSKQVGDFVTQPITPGSFVATRPALHGPWAKSCPSLCKQSYWLWNIHRVIQPGGVVPGFKKPAETGQKRHAAQWSLAQGLVLDRS